MYINRHRLRKTPCLVADPIDYRWNFLAYISSDYPFSEKSCRGKLSRVLRRAMKEVDSCCTDGLWLNYNQLNRLYKSLSPEEQNQLTDYIIRVYSPFDWEKLVSYYKSQDMMMLAIRSTTGAEYDIKEEYNRFSDINYQDIERYVIEKLSLNPKSLLILSVDEKIELAKQIEVNTTATMRQIAKYLHLPLK